MLTDEDFVNYNTRMHSNVHVGTIIIILYELSVLRGALSRTKHHFQLA